MPRVSVNIACYNSAKFIGETLESVLNQTFSDFEIIVVDDGSSDDTSKIVSSFKDDRIKYFYKANEGLAHTRNKTIALSHGEYIAFLDHDDLWLPRKLEKQLDKFNRNNKLGLVFADLYIQNGSKRKKGTYFGRGAPAKGFILEELLFSPFNFIALSAVMMPKRIFDRSGLFRFDLKIGEEWELFLRTAADYECDYVDEPLVIYKTHESNFSRNKDVYFREAFTILDYWQSKRPDIFLRNNDKFLKKQADIFTDLAHFHALNLRKADALANFSRSLAKHKNVNVEIKRWILLFFGFFAYRLICKAKNVLFSYNQ